LLDFFPFYTNCQWLYSDFISHLEFETSFMLINLSVLDYSSALSTQLFQSLHQPDTNYLPGFFFICHCITKWMKIVVVLHHTIKAPYITLLSLPLKKTYETNRIKSDTEIIPNILWKKSFAYILHYLLLEMNGYYLIFDWSCHKVLWHLSWGYCLDGQWLLKRHRLWRE
jgi:hypothetical protein